MKQNETKSTFQITKRGFQLEATLDCGQCFRFQKKDGWIVGMAGNHFLKARQEGGTLIFDGMDPCEWENFWRKYLDFNTDYSIFHQLFSMDPTMQKAMAYAGGIRILRQDSWEALCSFILSQNNNIPRIKGIISRLCEQFGERMEYGYGFPKVERIASCDLEELSGLRAGFRAKYLLDAARKIADGSLDFAKVQKAELDEARELLQQIHGVGPKVAECTLLFGFYRLEAFPVDVWMKRVLCYFYPEGLPDCFHPYAGVAQQMLFHYIRTCPDAVPEQYRKAQ